MLYQRLCPCGESSSLSPLPMAYLTWATYTWKTDSVYSGHSSGRRSSKLHYFCLSKCIYTCTYMHIYSHRGKHAHIHKCTTAHTHKPSDMLTDHWVPLSLTRTRLARGAARLTTGAASEPGEADTRESGTARAAQIWHARPLPCHGVKLLHSQTPQRDLFLPLPGSWCSRLHKSFP